MLQSSKQSKVHRMLPGLLLSVLVLAPGSAAFAHGGAELEEDPCLRRFGEGFVHFNGYQPRLDPKGHYCFTLPGSGQSFVVIDLVGAQLRREPTSARIVSTAKSGEDTASVAEANEMVRKAGVIEMESDLAPGPYEAIVSLAGNSPAEIRLPFKVGIKNSNVLSWMGPLILGGLVLFFMHRRFGRSRTAGSSA